MKVAPHFSVGFAFFLPCTSRRDRRSGSQIVPPGRRTRFAEVPGTSYLATFIESLRDNSERTRPTVRRILPHMGLTLNSEIEESYSSSCSCSYSFAREIITL
jgi:hypothetical protein